MRKKSIVERGYDEIAERYHADRSAYDAPGELSIFMGSLKKGSHVLDLGCGSGVPIAKTLVSEGFQVTGIDFSERMVSLAEKNVPGAVFLRKDMTELDFADDSFDGAVAFYSIIHVPREKHAAIFAALHRMLKNGAILLACMGADDWEAVQDYKGTKMSWSQYGSEKNVGMIKDSGFDILSAEVKEISGETHLWVLAKNVK